MSGWEELLDLVYQDPATRQALLNELVECGEVDLTRIYVSNLAVVSHWIHVQIAMEH